MNEERRRDLLVRRVAELKLALMDIRLRLDPIKEDQCDEDCFKRLLEVDEIADFAINRVERELRGHDYVQR